MVGSKLEEIEEFQADSDCSKAVDSTVCVQHGSRHTGRI